MGIAALATDSVIVTLYICWHVATVHINKEDIEIMDHVALAMEYVWPGFHRAILN